MGSRWSRSLALARQSIAVLRGNPALMTFPIVSGIVTFFLTLSFFVPAYLAYGHRLSGHERIPPLGYAVMAAYYLVSYFVVIFFNVGLTSCTYASLRGERPTFADGVRYAQGRMGPILGWTVLSATVGLVLQFVGERAGFVGRIIVGLLGAAWNVVTYLVVPVVAVEGKGPVASVKESTALLKRTWGEQLIGNGGVGLIFGLAALIPVVPLIAALASGSVAAMLIVFGLSVLFWLGLAILSASVAGVYRTALYVYATTGAAPSGFDPSYVSSAFAPKPQSKVGKFFRGR